MLRLSQSALIFAIVFFFNVALAHPPGLSSADVTISHDNLDAKITFAIQDIEAFVPMDSDQDAEVTSAERDATKPAIAQFIAEQFKILSDNQNVNPSAPGKVEFDDKNNATVLLHYQTSHQKAIDIASIFLSKLPKGHKQYLTVVDASGHELARKMLTTETPDLQINLDTNQTEKPKDAAAQPTVFIDFLKLGIEHIITGYDHLLFLFSLLVVTHSFWPALKIITFFTIAHSITLGLAGLNLVNIPNTIVEPLIAATIIYVGLENIIKKNKVSINQRCALTFFFGLIHGFGFAGVLREMDISLGETNIIVPLFSFNLGVELGQIAVASVVLPLIWWLHKQGKISRYIVPVGSLLTCLAGSYWLVERTLLS